MIFKYIVDSNIQINLCYYFSKSNSVQLLRSLQAQQQSTQ